MGKMSDKDWHNTIALDFDGVICEFGTDKAGIPVEGAFEGIKALLDAGWYIEIHSGKCNTPDGIASMMSWFMLNAPGEIRRAVMSKKINVSGGKPTAKVYIDDRGITFTGWADITPDKLESFRAWWQHPASTK